MKKILTVGIRIPGDQSEYVSFNSDQSLLDADTVVFLPDISELYGHGYKYYQGKPCLSDQASFELKASLKHWRREIQEALSAGKTVFIILSEKQEVCVDTGQRQYSGTGRNRHTTIIVEPCNNYSCLPMTLSFIPCTGESMRRSERDDLLADYWETMAGRSTYKVTIDGKVTQPLIVSRDGSRNLGAMVQLEDVPGHLILLPATGFDDEDFIEEKEGQSRWTKEALAIGATFVRCIVSIDKVLRGAGDITPQPPWASNPIYDLPRERELRVELLKIEKEIKELGSKKGIIQGQIRHEILLKHLLYEKGKALEHAIVMALRILGFSSEPYRAGDSEFDVVFESQEGRLVGEAEGKDNKAINIDKMRQLEMNIHEDFERENVTAMAKGVLFGSAYRLSPLEERGDYFTQKCLTAAIRNSCALVRTPDLYFAAQYLSATDDQEYARQCREQILTASGSVVLFPSPPEGPLGSVEEVSS